MNLVTAQIYATKITEWIAPHVADEPASASGKAMLTAGSIRRCRPVCGDVDIVCVPAIREERDLFGEITCQRNRLHEFLSLYVASGRAQLESGSDETTKSMILQLSRCQLDLWFATPATFATRLMCRTGSKEHNIWLCQRAKRLGMKWNPYEGVYSGGVWRQWPSNGEDYYAGGTLVPCNTEEEIYKVLGLPHIAPEHRELAWLTTHFGA